MPITPWAWALLPTRLASVYNHKRNGRYTLNEGRHFYFLKRSLSVEKQSEFLLVDLINNLHFLAEDKESVLNSVAEKVRSMDKSN